MPSKSQRTQLRDNLNPDETSEVFADYSDDMGQIARIKQRIAVRFKHYHSIGGEPAEIKMAYKLDNMDDAPGYLRGIIKTAAILRIIPTETEESGQINFLAAFSQPSPEADAKVAMARVRNDGYNSGRAGAPIDNCPFNAGSEEFVAWRDMWEDGASDLAKVRSLKPNTEAASTERRPRGRPPGSKNKRPDLKEAA